MGKLGDESGLVDIAFAHYSAVLGDENADDIVKGSADLLLAELKNRFPLIGKNIHIENVKLMPVQTLPNKIKDFIVVRLAWLIIFPILTIIISFI